MAELDQCFCPKEKCKDFGLRHQGNIAIRGKYGKDKNRDLLYCRTCGRRFGAARTESLGPGLRPWRQKWWIIAGPFQSC